MDWFKLGEEASTMFGIKTRKAGNSIFVLKDVHGNLLEDKLEVENEIVNFYINLFGKEASDVPINFSNYPGLKIDNSEHPMLCDIPTNNEIKRAV